MASAKAVIVKREGCYHPRNGSYIPPAHPYGARILDGEYKGALFALSITPGTPVGSYVTVTFVPEDQFATVVR